MIFKISKIMSTKEQRSKLVQGLQDYLDNTSPEQLEKIGKNLRNLINMDHILKNV